ncbi:unnamed protein product [Absidia cylindrospora]
MVSACSGIINDRVYAVTPSSNSYTYSLNSTSFNGTSLGNGSECPTVTSFIYTTCTVISNPPTIVMVGTDSSGTAGTRLLQFSSNGSCQKSEKWYSITGMIQPVSVVPASCDSQPSVPCFAVLGISSSTRQYIIQYPTSLSFNSANPISIGAGDSSIHPVLALPPTDATKLYVIGYPTKDQILVLLNGIRISGQPSIVSTTTNIPYAATTTTTIAGYQASNKNNLIAPRAEPTYGSDSGNNGAGSSIRLEAAIENAGPAVTVGNNIVIVSSSSLSVDIISTSSYDSSGSLPITKLNIPPSSQVPNANSLKGIDSLTPLPAQNGDLSTIWINYDDGNGNHIQTSSQQPGLFGTSDGTGSGTPTGSIENAGGPSLSTGAIVGIVIGCVVGCILLALVCFFTVCRRRRQRQRQHVGANNANILLTEKTVSTPTTYASAPNKDDDTSAMSPTGNMHYHNNAIDNDDTPPTMMTSLTRKVNNNDSDGNYYEPSSTHETLLLQSFAYTLHKEAPSYAFFPQGYATRTATRTYNLQHTPSPRGQQSIECTIHYFPASSLPWFRQLINTNAGLQDHHRQAAMNHDDDNNDDDQETPSAAGLHTYDAITLSQPTAQGHYQYIWITSPFHQQHTLQSLLFDNTNGGHSVVDCTQFSFKAWSTLSMLKSLNYFHQCGWIHRKLNGACFFYDQASSVTEWRLTGFYQSIWYTGLPDDTSHGVSAAANNIIEWDECSAPECMASATTAMISYPSMDIWSLGCVLYSVATGKRAFQHLNEYQMVLRSGQLQTKITSMLDEVALVDDSFKELLRRMLHISPNARDSMQNLISYWIQVNQLDDDE